MRGVGLTETATTLATLLDRIEIRELSARYNHAFDDALSEEFAATFTQDGVFEMVGTRTLVGRSEIAAFTAGIGWGVVHATTDAIVEVMGDSARQVCTLLVATRNRAGKRQHLLATGRYTDTLERTDEGWRFAKRSAAMDRDMFPNGM
jgi:uncharacterized protein (TIGR02246 family)